MKARTPKGRRRLRNLQRGGKENALHDCIRTSDSGVDDTAHARDSIPKCRSLATGRRRGTEVSAYELGRGHRQGRAAATPHSMEVKMQSGTPLLLTIVKYPFIFELNRPAWVCRRRVGRGTAADSDCNLLLTDGAHTEELWAAA